MLKSLRPYLILMRPANIVTAIADILAGISVAGFLFKGSIAEILGLVLATIGLYGGGVVFNDVFDRELDKVERPERPLPSGQVSLKQASLLGGSLLVLGILAAGTVSWESAGLALLVAILALTYDKYAKHYVVLGPINMGLCRSFNLLLGISISLLALKSYWFLGFIPLVFIADITLTSQGEVKGKNISSLYIALALDLLVASTFVVLYFYTDYELLAAAPFILFWLFLNLRAKLRAIQQNEPRMIMKAVKAGVLSLIPLNAAMAAGFEGFISGLIVLALLPLSLGLARYFSVT
ncbi:MAG TPA: UbiA-like protein EboC [Saprospiraceae bacterium]|nr:UbiA-like protein EboC [Saprospiraceae bacterium]